MNRAQDAIKKIVIVGGGTAGWLAAATIGNIFKNSQLQIELVESDDIGVIGVGEATVPPIINILSSLGIDLAEFVKATQGSFKLGIKFDGWSQQGKSFFHPFGSLGRTINDYDFFQCWLKCRAEGDNTPLMAHSPEAVLAEQEKFFIPFEAQNTPLARVLYALHFDASLAGKFLRKFAEGIGIKRTEGTVEQVNQTEDGTIAAVTLKSGQVVTGDFFIDCTGFRGLLIEQTLATGYDDWSHYLPCNKAVAVQTENTGATLPYTISSAKEAGWTWRIPLQHRTGNGYVYCDKYVSDEQAKRTLLESVDGKLLTEPRVIPFTTGMRKQAWVKNCLSLGLAQGFLEPLESTAIHLVSKSIAYFIQMFPSRHYQPALVEEYNRRIAMDYQEIRDFLVLHYCTSQRDDSDFWRWCRSMKIPPSLQYKMDYFKASGKAIVSHEQLFQSSSWYAIYQGMGIKPNSYNPTLDLWQPEKLQAILDSGKQGLIEIAAKQPSHDEFLVKYCQAPEI
ncbi:tryptophan halogenase [Thalassotalea insulae]|uniref:Tryptophan halogenase n=1 Tax=Thalassotalea insulae TaxID=2056778 RepID=A0ABQ6GT83_9GAMM|nr:tryptophan halogenase family protein [Thalassotalea insulae]GLX79158.1 tryptophan halogenase [Thalassotalea insulae]